MKESPAEKYSRVQQMILDKGDTWDLSRNDKDALRHVLGLINLLADELASRTGLPVPTVINNAAEKVAAVQR